MIFFEFQKFKMPAVVHRSMQRHGATGSQVPIRLRTCPSCQIVFKSKTGLLQHQSRKKNVGCFRAGILRLRHNWIKKRNDYHSTWRKKQVPEVHVSVREEWKGKSLQQWGQANLLECLPTFEVIHHLLIVVFSFLCRISNYDTLPHSWLCCCIEFDLHFNFKIC